MEVWTDRASSSATDYMMGGFWLNTYRITLTAGLQQMLTGFYFTKDKVIDNNPGRFTGTATYKDIGLDYFSERDNFQRLTGSVKLNANFKDDEEFGTISGRINDLALDGKSVKDKLKLNPGYWLNRDYYHHAGTVEGNVNGIKFDSDKWTTRFTKIVENQPSKLAGSASGSTVNENNDGYYNYQIIFGAKKEE